MSPRDQTVHAIVSFRHYYNTECGKTHVNAFGRGMYTRDTYAIFTAEVEINTFPHNMRPRQLVFN